MIEKMLKGRLPIQKLWTDYQKLCVPPDANSIQIAETRKAFFVGFISMFEINLIIGSDVCSEEIGVALLEEYRDEIVEYMRIMGIQEDDRRYSN